VESTDDSDGRNLDGTGSPKPGRFRDGVGWEEFAGYSRAAKVGPFVAVSGTTAHGPDGRALHEGDTYQQTLHCLSECIAAVESLGARREGIVRTRILLGPGASWQDAARAHASMLGDVAPANSMYEVSRLIGDGFLVEVELDAVATS